MRTKPRTTLASIATLAAIALATTLSSHATLLVYEGFNYTTGTAIPGGTGVQLNGQGTAGELGLTGTWTAQNTGAVANSTTVYPQGSTTGITAVGGVPVNIFNGTVANLATSGGFFGVTNATITGNGTDHIEAWRPLAASVTATFITGNTTWFSFVSARGYSANPRSPSFYIGAGHLGEDRGNTATAPGIGGGGSTSGGAGLIFPSYWNTGLTCNNGTAIPTTDYLTWQGAIADLNGFGASNVTVGKIEWNADTNGGDIITIFNFSKTDIISETAFNAGITAKPMLSSKNWPAHSPNLDETTFNMISIGGGRFFADEIRIGTTFSDVTPGNGPVPTITAVGSPLAAMSTTVGTPSNETNFTVSGADMTAGILVTAPTGFEVSQTSGSDYAGTTTVSGSGTIASTTVYVRLAATAAIGDYNSKHIVLSSTGASPVNVTTAATGNTVSPAVSPVITASPLTLIAVTTTYGTASAETSFTVSGADMLAGILVTAPTGFEVTQTSGSGYGTTTTVGASGTIANTTVYVRLKATAPAAGSYDGQNIVLSSSTATNVNVTTAAIGNTVSPKALTVTATGPTKPYGTALTTGPSAANFTAGATGVGSEAVSSVTLTPDAAGLSPTSAVGVAYTVTPSAATGTGGFLASNYDITYTPYNGTVAIGTPTLSINNSPALYDGLAHAAVVVASTDGTVSNVKYNGSDTVPSAAGTYAVTADFAPTDNSNYSSLTAATAGNFVIKTMIVNVQFYWTGAPAVSMTNLQGPVASASPTRYWNQITSASHYNNVPAGPTVLTQVDGTASGISLLLSGNGNIRRADGWGPGVGQIPMFSGEAYLDGNSQTLISEFSGLTVGVNYDLYAMNSRGSTSDSRFTVNGNTACAIRLRGMFTANNTPNDTVDWTQFGTTSVDVAGDATITSTASTAYFKALTPDVDGKLTVVMSYANSRIDVDAPFIGLSGFQLVQVPATSGTDYASWALTHSVTGGVSGDSNNDGVQNGIAYFMGLTGPLTNPGLNASNTVTWPMSATFSGTYEVQISSNLGTWTPVDPQPTRDLNGNLVYTLPTGLGKQFVRLVVTPN